FHVVQAVVRRSRDSRGSIVALTSAGLVRHPVRDILSTAPKAAIEALVRGLAREEGRHGVRANSVAVGVIDAGLFQRLSVAELKADWLEAARRSTPLGRFGSADDVAEAVVFLASRRAAFVTGVQLVVDGGYSVCRCGAGTARAGSMLVRLRAEGTAHRGIDDARNIAKLLPHCLGRT